ncbi:MAG: ABC transporter ATP-binding protein [Spirochaetota bacterium]
MRYIALRGVTKRFGKVVAVENFDLEVGKGEFHTLLGPSGCGKTTILRMIAGLEDPDEGEIYIGGKCVFSREKGVFMPPPDRGVGLIFQSYALWPHMTVYNNIAFGLPEKGLPKQEIAKAVIEILAKFRMAGYENRYPSELSGGEQQRVAIARMVVTKPPVFLMDEPLSNLDAKLRMRLRSEIKRVHGEAEATTVYVTHDQVEAMTLSDYISVIKDGVLQQTASPAGLYNDSANLFVSDFMANPQINLLDGIISNNNGKPCFLSDKAGIHVPIEKAGRDLINGRRVFLTAHPEWLRLSVDRAPDSVRMDVYSVLMAGCETLIFLESEDVVLVTRQQGQGNINKNQSLWVSFTAFNIYDRQTQKLLLSYREGRR